MLSKNKKCLCSVKDKVILTPHPGEMARLIGKDISYVEKNRIECSRAFAKQYKCIVLLKGYNTVITYNSHKDEAIELQKEINDKYNTESLVIKCDISKEEDIENLKQEIINKFNKLDVLVNNASIAIDTTFSDKTKENYMKILEINLVGTFLVSKIMSTIMNDNSSIINISSTNGIDTYYEYSLDYDSSKAGIINLSHNLANYLSPKIRVNTIELTPEERTLGSDVIKPEILNDLQTAMNIILEKICNRISKAYDKYDILF